MPLKQYRHGICKAFPKHTIMAKEYLSLIINKYEMHCSKKQNFLVQINYEILQIP